MFQRLRIGRVEEVSDLGRLNGLLAETLEWESTRGPQVSAKYVLMETLRRGETVVYLVGEQVTETFLDRGGVGRQVPTASRAEGAGTRSGAAECQCPQPSEKL